MVKTEASQPARRTVPTNQEIIEIDDDVAILGVENECKLPHARGDCPKHKFQIGSHGVCANHCAQCYCYESRIFELHIGPYWLRLPCSSYQHVVWVTESE